MKVFRFFISLFFFFFSLGTLAATAVAPENRIRIWDGPFPLSDGEYMLGSSSLGSVKTLKYTTTAEGVLKNINYAKNTGGLDMSGKILTKFQYNGNSYMRLSESSVTPPSGECVAFAKAMTGSTGSSTWYKGKAISSYLAWNGIGYRLGDFMSVVLQPGTMIAHFQGLTKYPQSTPYGHVAIFLSWSYDSRGYIDGINVIDQNLIWTISGVSGSQGTIQKHKIPLSGSNTAVYNSIGYHVVDVH